MCTVLSAVHNTFQDVNRSDDLVCVLLSTDCILVAGRLKHKMKILFTQILIIAVQFSFSYKGFDTIKIINQINSQLEPIIANAISQIIDKQVS